MKRWHLLHVGVDRWLEPPEQIEIPLEVTPSPDMTAFAIPGLLVLRAVGGLSSEQEVYGIDPLTGRILWRFSESDDDVLFFSCHVEHHKRIVATTRHGVYRLTREGPQRVLEAELSPISHARLAPSGEHGFVIDGAQRLLIFSTQTQTITWSRQAPGQGKRNKGNKGQRFGNPFPLGDDALCLSTGRDVRCWDLQGKTRWRWPEKADDEMSYAIERLVLPDLLLLRVQSPHHSYHITLRAQTGEFLAALGDVWAYGADGVYEHPIPLFEGERATLAFLNHDGTASESQKLHKMIGGFRTLPDGCAALWYDALTRMIVATNADGKIAWRESYPDASSGLAATYFDTHTAYFASGSGALHVWDVDDSL